jgi:hypothetical protein
MTEGNGGKARASLRKITVECPAWSPEPVTLREPRVRDYMAIRNIVDEQEKTVHLLAAMVLDEKGDPVGLEAIMDAPMLALTQLSEHVNKMLGGEDNGPLTTPSS